MDISIVNGVIRAVAPAVVAYLVGKGVIPVADYGELIAAVTALTAAAWSVASKKKASV